MEENKKITPLEFVNYLEGFFNVIGKRGLNEWEAVNIRKMLDCVDKCGVQNEIKQLEPLFPNLKYNPHNSTVPDPNFYHGNPENICYCYIENGEKK